MIYMYCGYFWYVLCIVTPLLGWQIMYLTRVQKCGTREIVLNDSNSHHGAIFVTF